MSDTKNTIGQALDEIRKTFGTVTDSWALALRKTAQSKNITIEEWNHAVIAAGIISSNCTQLLELLDKVVVFIGTNPADMGESYSSILNDIYTLRNTVNEAIDDVKNGDTVVGKATQAERDASGNDIESTYATIEALESLQNKVNEEISAIYRPIGTYADFPKDEDLRVGDCFNSSEKLTLNGVEYPIGTNFVYLGAGIWDALAGFVNLSPIEEQIDDIAELLNNVLDTNAETPTVRRANADSNGNLIHETYASKEDLEPYVTNLVNGSGEGAVMQPYPDWGGNKASGDYSAAFGMIARATARAAFAAGSSTESSAYAAFSTGSVTRAKYEASFTAGQNTATSRKAQMAVGEFNEDATDALFIVGNGNRETHSNALIVREDGRTTVGAEPVDSMDVATKSITDGLDERVSYLESFNLGYNAYSTDNGVLSCPESAYLAEKAFLNEVGGISAVWEGYTPVKGEGIPVYVLDINNLNIPVSAGSYYILDASTGYSLHGANGVYIYFTVSGVEGVQELYLTTSMSTLKEINVPYDVTITRVYVEDVNSLNKYKPYIVSITSASSITMLSPNDWLGFRTSKPLEVRSCDTNSNTVDTIDLSEVASLDGWGEGFYMAHNAVDLETQTYTQLTATAKFDGSDDEMWEECDDPYFSSGFRWFRISTRTLDVPANDLPSMVCDRLRVVNSGTLSPSEFSVAKANQDIDVYVPYFLLQEYNTDGFDDVTAFRRFLSYNPIEIQYCRETPAVTDVTLPNILKVKPSGSIKVVTDTGDAAFAVATFVVPRE